MIDKILYIGSKYEYGDKRKGESVNKKGFYDNFINLGYSVTPLWYDKGSNKDLQERIMATAKTVEPDIIFFILQSDQIFKNTLIKLKKKGYFLVNWFGDDQWRWIGFTSLYANFFDVCITTDKFSVDKYKKIGQGNILRSQWASFESDINYKSINYKYDVSFIGGVSPYRLWFVRSLRGRGIDVNCFGDGWENGRVSYQEMEEIFAKSKINLNISNSSQFDARYLISGLKNILNTFRSKKNVSQTKARIFEIPAQGGFELTEYVPSLDDYFEIGKELVCYSSIDEAELLIKHYLFNNEDREMIKLRGVFRARNDHTYTQRILKFMKEIENIYERER
jgi:spore maturation protein CgeB